jgi:hypothetical protein
MPIAKWKKQQKEQLDMDVELTMMLARGNLPFSLVEQDWFQDFMQAACPRLNLKHRTTYAGPKLDIIYDQMIEVRDNLLNAELPSCKIVAITFDHWSSRNNDPFICITLHYVNQDFMLRKFTLAILHHPERHDAKNIAKLLDEIVEAIPPLMDCKIVATVDQAANMKAALNESVHISAIKDKSLTCLDHKLNTALLRAAESDQRVKDAIAQAKAVATRIHQSFKSEAILIEQCRILKSKFSFVFVI